MNGEPSPTNGLTDWQRRQLRQMLDSWRAADFDPHVVLGLQRPASLEQITDAHRRLVAEFHPDRHLGDPLAHELLKRINVARDTLLSLSRQTRDTQPSSKRVHRYHATPYQQHHRSQERNRPYNRQSNQSDQTSTTTQQPKRPGCLKTILWIFVIFVVALSLIRLFSGLRESSPITETVIVTRTIETIDSDVETPSATLKTPRRTPTSIPTSTPEIDVKLSTSDVDEWRKYALSLINDERQKVGLHPLILDDNPASQNHAEDMRENCFISPWGTDGMKPYMRYTLSGGEQHTSDIIHGANYCPTFGFLYEKLSIEQDIQDVISFAIDMSPESDIFNPYASKLSIGFAYGEPNLWTSMSFISDFVEYRVKPFIHNDMLEFRVTVKNGVDLSKGDLGVETYFDPIPYELKRGQLHQTNCYWYGDVVALILEPGWDYEDETFAFTSEQCIDPYDIPIDTAEVDAYEDLPTPTPVAVQEEAIIIVAEEWEIEEDEIYIKTDVSLLTTLLGDGVYTVMLIVDVDGELIPISTYSVFVPPRTN